MLRLNKLTDYAVILLTTLAGRSNVVTVAELAEQTAIPTPTIAKILKKLAKSDILGAQRGAAGGYRLVKPTSAVTMADIIAAMDGPIALTDCVDGHIKNCNIQNICSMHGHWEKINRAVRGALESVTLADMCANPARAESGHIIAVQNASH
jgi:FeS assembly SUF system regulator